MSGFDSNSLNYGLLFSLTMEEATGTAITGDAAKPHHTTSLTHSPAWVQLPSGVWVMDFNSAHPDYLQCSAATTADLDFTSGAFSVSMWIKQHASVASTRYLINRGDGAGAHGWCITTYNNYLYWGTPGSVEIRSTGAFSINVWSLIIVTKSGTLGKSFVNGIELSYILQGALNPTTDTEKLLIGIFNDEATGAWDGEIWNPRIWNRALSPEEIYYMFQRERWMFRV